MRNRFDEFADGVIEGLGCMTLFYIIGIIYLFCIGFNIISPEMNQKILDTIGAILHPFFHMLNKMAGGD